MKDDHITIFPSLIPTFVSFMLQDYKARNIPLIAEIPVYNSSENRFWPKRIFIGTPDKFVVNINNNPDHIVYYRINKTNFLSINLPFEEPYYYSISYPPNGDAEPSFLLAMYNPDKYSNDISHSYILFIPTDFQSASLTTV